MLTFSKNRLKTFDFLHEKLISIDQYEDLRHALAKVKSLNFGEFERIFFSFVLSTPSQEDIM